MHWELKLEQCFSPQGKWHFEMRFQKGLVHITSGQILVSSWEEMNRRMEASIKVDISDVLCWMQFYLQMEHHVFTALPLYIVNWTHDPKLLLISCRDQEEFSFCKTWPLSFLALSFSLCTCFWNTKGWPQIEWRRGSWFWQDKIQFQVLLRKCWNAWLDCCVSVLNVLNITDKKGIFSCQVRISMLISTWDRDCRC